MRARVHWQVPSENEEGRRARPRYDVPLRDAVPPTWVRRDAIT